MEVRGQIDNRLTGIALAVPNTGYVGTQLAPNVDVGARKFKWRRFATNDAFAVPDDRIGEYGRAREVNFASELLDGSTSGKGLKAPVAQTELDDAANGTGPKDPTGTKTMKLTMQRDNAHEARVATFYTTAGNYADGYKPDLSADSGAAQWDQADQDILGQLDDAIRGMLVRPNTFWMGSAVWSAVARSSQLIATVYPGGGNAATGGLISLEALTTALRALGIQRIVVGDARYNTAKMGQNRSLSAFFGKHAGLCRLDDQLVDMDPVEPVFCANATTGMRTVRTWEDQDMGTGGGIWVGVYDQDELVQFCQQAGYLFQNAVQ